MWRWSCYPFCIAWSAAYSPRMWRWSWNQDQIPFRLVVFSTYVGVILIFDLKIGCVVSILHVCGGDPKIIEVRGSHLQYSPRMWRWSYDLGQEHGHGQVFSTYVEVILCDVFFAFLGVCILHVCGGDPRHFLSNSFLNLYSPRMWRWSQ